MFGPIMYEVAQRKVSDAAEGAERQRIDRVATRLIRGGIARRTRSWVGARMIDAGAWVGGFGMEREAELAGR